MNGLSERAWRGMWHEVLRTWGLVGAEGDSGALFTVCSATCTQSHPQRVKAGIRGFADEMEPLTTTVEIELDPIARIDGLLHRGDVDAAVRLLLVSWVGSITGPQFHRLDAVCVRLPQATAQSDCAPDGDDRWHLAFAEMLVLDDRVLVAEASERVWKLYGEGVALDRERRTAALHHLGWVYIRHRYHPDRGIQVLSLAMRESAALGDEALRVRAGHQLASLLARSGGCSPTKEGRVTAEQC